MKGIRTQQFDWMQIFFTKKHNMFYWIVNDAQQIQNVIRLTKY